MVCASLCCLAAKLCRSTAEKVWYCVIVMLYKSCTTCLVSRYKELMNKAISDFCCSPLLPRGTKQIADPVLRTLRALDAARNAARHAGCSGLQQWLEVFVKMECSLQQTSREQALLQMEQQVSPKFAVVCGGLLYERRS
eukprot:351140-Chlamydomonas_euryale.AAC.50